MTISSTGVGSGLDVKSIVSQLVAIERQPLKALQTTASKYQTQLSVYGTIKSQVSALGDAAGVLATASGWSAQQATSSNSTAVAVTAGSSAVASSMSVTVQQLAQAQAVTSVGVTAGSAVGATGSLSIQLGTWTGASFAADGASAATPVTVSATDTVATIAAAINAANAGVTASVLNDGTNDRLVMRSTSTGLAAGFSVTPTGGNAALNAYGFTNSTLTTPSASGMFMGQSGLDANLKVNGVALTSASNNMSNVMPGVSLQLLQTAATAVDIAVTQDTDAVQKNIQSFVDAYNALSQTISDATKYNAATKTGGPLQGDSTTLGLQGVLRSMLGSSSTGSTFSNLSQVGLERQTNGSLKINATKLDAAKLDMTNLQKLFTTNNSDATTNGFGLKVRDFARGMITFDGAVSNKSSAIQGAITRNTSDQDRVNERATRVEAQLLRQYSALDTQMAQWNSLSSYMNSQISQWNKSTA
ncbi:MAG: flagellar filament capping protein FliD [Rhodoferax sp.]|uniref:flagellar filament capping protein FliD n=1 Tax=Rhodoferax sp. TaxID=50421 RepID=UPI00262C52B5|nr:flagellar filament capping protein FliD [Rhodoferax sp.]MDD2880965.1 flagellar filament capping protein FliD [Rhodoferax sp.]